MHRHAFGVEHIIEETLVVEHVARSTSCLGSGEATSEVVCIDDLAEFGGSSLELSDLIFEEAMQTTFSFVILIIKSTDVPEVVAVVEYPDSGEVRFFFFKHNSI